VPAGIARISFSQRVVENDVKMPATLYASIGNQNGLNKSWAYKPDKGRGIYAGARYWTLDGNYDTPAPAPLSTPLRRSEEVVTIAARR
jgi:hypothetical protein